ncbi:hypothetical protein SGGMMB4_00350 [Sodalis glossinidius str. 'morsitans']|uniref:Lipoprotein n=1 Tax=Sodalis glossinidius (strain morsitans) TaxID=343509 RepID=A0A193QFS6_SODGM|nr:hypothetical protein [Sodalis glossinidius]CRL43775.1 hypothetical protein SGGMMB4_00350 [Sodalis glossinidius str. 'morsitans']
MKGKHLIPIILLISSCSFHQMSTSEQKLFDKVQSAILTQDMNKLSELEYEKIATYISEGKVH